jgi:hypothetical protein
MNYSAQELEGLSIASVAHAIVERAEARFGNSQRAERLRALLCEVARLADEQTDSMQHVRRGSSLLYVFPLVVAAVLLLLLAQVEHFGVTIETGPTHVADLLQGVDAGVALMFVAAGLLVGAYKLPKAWLRRKFRAELRKLRRAAEKIYLVQLDKDPERLTRDEDQQGENSPRTELSAWDMHRYLSYARTALMVLGMLAYSYVDVAPDEDAEESAQELAEFIMSYKADVRRKWERMEELRRREPALFRRAKGRALVQQREL